MEVVWDASCINDVLEGRLEGKSRLGSGGRLDKEDDGRLFIRLKSIS